MTSPAFTEFLLAALVMELTPGPNMTWLALLSAQQGRRAGFLAVAGIALGLAILALAAGAGAAALIQAYPALYEALRWGGIIFLLYLALEAWRGESGGDNRPGALARHFRRGLIVNLLNPKAATVFAVLIPAFAGSASPTGMWIAAMSAIYVAIATMVHALLVLFAGSFKKALAEPRREIVVRRIFALALIGVAVWFTVSTSRG